MPLEAKFRHWALAVVSGLGPAWALLLFTWLHETSALYSLVLARARPLLSTRGRTLGCGVLCLPITAEEPAEEEEGGGREGERREGRRGGGILPSFRPTALTSS